MLAIEGHPEPACLQDWEWKEEGWQIDMSGLLENAVDEEGWSYGVDFPWLQWPPAPGAGRFRKVCVLWSNKQCYTWKRILHFLNRQIIGLSEVFLNILQVRDYVRRRRWFRTRVHAGMALQESPKGLAPSLDDTTAPSMTSLLTGDLHALRS